MTSIFHKGRSRVALFAVLAMVASLMAIPLSAGAATAACPTTIPSAGFTDIGTLDQETQDAIDCIAFYDITQGTSATTYGPTADVSRWQMALFLTRKLDTAGVTLPSGAAQGFTDIGTLDAATQTAINQLAQLDITKGTTATTFDPTGIVNRWQMALFITRQLTAAGVTLPSGVAQGFTDIGTLDAATQTAINQLAQLGISKGTSATTYDPLGDVNRWQMALFLSRDLDVLGVVAAPLRVSVTPSTQASLGNGAARAYSATFNNADGSLYTGFVGIDLLDADTNNDPVYNTPAVAVTFQSVDGVATGGTSFGGFAGTDGTVTFIVRHAGAKSDVVPVAWIDLNADGDYESTGNNPPTEPFGLGGETDFSGAAAAEAANGTYTDYIVDSVDAAGNSFEAMNGALATFEYDSNDVFTNEGAPVDLDGFEAALSETDVITINYSDTAAGLSTFEITDDNTAASTLKVTDPSKATSIDSNNYVVKGTGEVGALIRIYSDDNPHDGAIAGETVLGTTTVALDGTWSVTVPLVQDATNDFVAWQRVAVGDTPTLAHVFTITEGAPAAAKISSFDQTIIAADGVLGPGDTLQITFNEKVAGVGNGDTIDLVDQDGSTATLVFNGDVTESLDATGMVLTLTINNIVFAVGGTTLGIQGTTQISAVSGFQGDDGLPINVTGSGSGRVEVID